MKSEIPRPRKSVAGRRSNGTGIPPLPIEWMDPMSWRLPSGKALAEFALQAGFLAPLILSGPRVNRKIVKTQPEPNRAAAGVHAAAKEAPEQSGTFRGTR